jgi:hypothetical protein
MRIKVTKRQFNLLVDRIDILSAKGLYLTTDVKTLRFVNYI